MSTRHQDSTGSQSSGAEPAALTEAGPRLSPIRVVVAVLLVSAITAAAVLGWRHQTEAAADEPVLPWFAGYVDVTATPIFGFEHDSADGVDDAVLSFIVSDTGDPCAPSWGTYYSLDEAGEALDLDRRIARLRQQGGEISVSFGGLLNDELAVSCTSPADLLEAYRSVVSRYEITTIDLDLEGTGLTDAAAATRRATAVAALQAERRAAGHDLAVWVTLPIAPSGLTSDGTDAVAALLAGGVDLAGVNAMTMDYGESKEDMTVTEATTAALTGLHRQLGILYDAADNHLSDGTLWSKIGATVMIGQNDVVDEVFDLDAAREVNAFVLDKGITRVSMWSANRDRTCGVNYVDLTVVSDSCSGVEQGEFLFSDVLSNGLTGTMVLSAGQVTTPEPSKAAEADDPATSPYPIWEETSSYLQDSKVVWHQNVYTAKWWTKGDLPDNPVLDEWETPWRLVGPVLPGETPLPQPEIPEGLFAEWAGAEVYDKGMLVAFDGTVYMAKWWNQAQSPEAASSDPDSSPWVPLSQKELDETVAAMVAETEGLGGEDHDAGDDTGPAETGSDDVEPEA